MKVILIVACLIAVTSALPTLSTMFPFLFKTRPPQTTPMPATIRREYNMRRTTNFFTKSKGKKHEKRKFHLQVSFGPIIYPEGTTPIYDEEDVAAQPQRPRPTTTEQADYEQIQESEEEILSEGFTEAPKTTTTVKSLKKKPHHKSFFQHLHDKFPKIHDWLYESEAAAAAPASQRPPRIAHHHKKKHHQRHPKALYTAPKKPKHTLTPPKKVAPKRRPTTTPRPRPRPRPTTQPPFEEEEDIQPGGQTPPPTPPPRRKTTTMRPTEFQQFPAKPSAPFEEEEDIQPGGQTPSKGYNYKKPKISREIFFYEPPPQFAPSKPKPYQPKPPLPPKKQYKVIFIKAPEPEPPIIPDIPQIQPAPEQKTLIYVVAKTPEEPPKITIDAPPETSSTKPDVFFVRYKVTTPQPDETEEDIQPGGQVPTTTKAGYKYSKPTPKPKPKPKPRPTTTTPYPDESEEDIQPGGQTEAPVKPSKEYLPATTPAPEEEEDIQPGGQLPPDEYLPPGEEEEDIQPGGQLPSDEYLPPAEEEEDIQPGGQEPTTPGTTYLPPAEEEEDIQPGGQLPPPTPSYDYLPQRPLEYGGYNSQPKPNNQYLPQPPPKYGPSSYNVPITYGQQVSNTYGNYNGNSFINNHNPNSYENSNSNSYFPQDQYQNQNNFYYNHKQPSQDNSYYNNHQQKNSFIDQIEPAVQTYFPQPQPLDYNERYFARRTFLDEDESLKNLLFTSLGLTGLR